jgi:hypothetical protein
VDFSVRNSSAGSPSVGPSPVEVKKGFEVWDEFAAGVHPRVRRAVKREKNAGDLFVSSPRVNDMPDNSSRVAPHDSASAHKPA